MLVQVAFALIFLLVQVRQFQVVGETTGRANVQLRWAQIESIDRRFVDYTDIDFNGAFTFKKVPEGIYKIDNRNAQSSFHLALHISYPSAEDNQRAAARGVSAGFDIMVHGIQNGRGWIGAFHRWKNWTAGCIALTDEEIEELWRVTPDGTVVEIRP